MSLDRPSALKVVADEARRMTLESIPEPVLRQARLCIVDTVGCVIAGTRTDEARLIQECETAQAGDMQAAVLGTSMRRALVPAVRINAYTGDVLELNDLIGGHASIGNVSTALALAEATGASGAALLEAVVRGIETTARVYGAVYPSLKRFTDMGMVPVGLPSAIGSAAVASRLLELDATRTLEAMAIAAGLAGWCPAEVIFGQGGTMKPILFGAQPGDAGVTAAFYARAGMTGPHSILDSKLGYFSTAATGGFIEPATAPRAWALAQPRRKLHACCGYIHSPADGMAKLRARLGNHVEEGEFEVRVAPYVADVVSKTTPPVSANDARFHLQYCLAIVVCGQDVLRPEHSIEFRSWMARPEVLRAMDRIRVIADPAFDHYHQSMVFLQGADGRRESQPMSAPRGSALETLSDDDVVAKYLSLAIPVIGDHPARRFMEDVTGLEQMADCSFLQGLSPDHKPATL